MNPNFGRAPRVFARSEDPAAVVAEAESITAEAASAAWVDEACREFERRQDEHLMRWGFDFPEAVES